jgi:hypothetical protein
MEWVDLGLARLVDGMGAKLPSLRTVPEEACQTSAWKLGGMFTAVGCHILFKTEAGLL